MFSSSAASKLVLFDGAHKELYAAVFTYLNILTYSLLSVYMGGPVGLKIYVFIPDYVRIFSAFFLLIKNTCTPRRTQNQLCYGKEQ